MLVWTLCLLHNFEGPFYVSLYCISTINYLLAWLQLWSLGSNKLQGVDICSLINYTTIIFSSELIWIDWSTQKVANFWFSKSFFYVKNPPNSSQFFFIEEFKIRRITFISDTFWLFSFLKHSIFWNRTQFLACSNQSKSISIKK